MKSVLSYVVALSLVGATGIAAPTTKSTAKKSTAKVSKKVYKKNVKRPVKAKRVAKAVPLPTRPETVDPSAPAASIKPASQSSKASLTQAVQEAKPKRFKLLLDSWNEVEVNSTNRGNSSATALNLVRPSYLLNDVSSVAVGIEFNNSWGTVKDNESKFQFTDPYLQYAHSNIINMKFAKITGAFRYYVPVSESSMNEDTGRFGRFRANMEMIGNVTPAVAIGYHLSPRYDFRKNLSYGETKTTTKKEIDPNTNQEVTVQTQTTTFKPTLQLTVVHFGFARADLGKKFSLYQNLGFVNQQWNEDNGLTKDPVANFYAETGLGYDFTKNFSLIAGVYTYSADTLTGAKKFNEGLALYNENDSKYFLEGVVSF